MNTFCSAVIAIHPDLAKEYRKKSSVNLIMSSSKLLQNQLTKAAGYKISNSDLFSLLIMLHFNFN